MPHSKIETLICGRVAISTRKDWKNKDEKKYATIVYHLLCEKKSWRHDLGIVTATLCGHEFHNNHDCSDCRDQKLSIYDVRGERLRDLRLCRSCMKSKRGLLGVTGETNHPKVIESEWTHYGWKGPVSFRTKSEIDG